MASSVPAAKVEGVRRSSGFLSGGRPAGANGPARAGLTYNVFRRPSIGMKAALLLVVLLASVVIGTGLAMGNKYVAFGLLGLLGGAFVLVIPVIVTFWAIILLAFLITGPITYFLHISQFQWLAPALDAAEYLQVALLILSGRLAKQTNRVPAFAIWLAVYLFLALFTSALSGITLAEAIMATRYSIFVWGALVVFLVGVVDDKTIDQLWRILLAIGWLQFPMAFYQYKFVASKRMTGEVLSEAPPWDAIIGTFPGTDTGGGNSAAMATYLLVLIVLAIALWREGRMKGAAAWGLVLSSLATISLAEVKAVVLLIPVVLGIYYYKEVLRRPIETFAALVLSIALAIGILSAYSKIHYSQRDLPVEAMVYGWTAWDQMLHAVSPDNVKESTGRLGRIALLVQWWDTNPSRGDLRHTFFGYGLGTTQVSKIGVGSVYQRWGLVGQTSLTILLWETGLLGLIAFAAMLAAGALLSSRYARDPRVPVKHRVYLRVGTIGLLLFLLTLPYKPYAVRLFPTMVLMIIMLGQAHYWFNRLANEDHRDRLTRSVTGR